MPIVFSLLFLLTFSSSSSLSLSSSSSEAPKFVCGSSSTDSDASGMNALKQLNATHARTYVMWKYVEAELSSLESNLTVAALRSNPQLIYQWSALQNWKTTDNIVQTFAQSGVQMIIEVGEGTFNGLPKYNNTLADPNTIGQQLYLAYQYRFCRAAVNRYKAYSNLWQIENELNEAWLSGFAGQRLANLSGAWKDWDFLTTLLTTLNWAVKDEDSTLMTTMNFHTDVPKEVHTLLGLPGFYLDAIASWATPPNSLMDIVSIDAYPNMYAPSPSLGSVVGDRVGKCRAQLPTSMEVFVMETGYPVSAPSNTSLPAIFNYSEALQSQYIEDAFTSVISAGGIGMLYFDLHPIAGMAPPSGGYTEEDVEMMTAASELLVSGNVTAVVDWLMAKGSIEEVIQKGMFFADEPMKGFSLVDTNYNHRVGFATLARLCAQG